MVATAQIVMCLHECFLGQYLPTRSPIWFEVHNVTRRAAHSPARDGGAAERKVLGGLSGSAASTGQPRFRFWEPWGLPRLLVLMSRPAAAGDALGWRPPATTAQQRAEPEARYENKLRAELLSRGPV